MASNRQTLCGIEGNRRKSMAVRWLSLAALLLGTTLLAAQQPAMQQPPPARPDLDGVLNNWEKAMNSLSSIQAQVTRKDIDKVTLTAKTFEGEAKFVKPDKASLWLRNADPKKQLEFERLICNGQTAYMWVPQLKEIQVYQLPKSPQGQIGDDNF